MPIPLGVLAVAGAGGGAAASSFDLLETTVLGTAAASITFSSLGSYSDYKHLQIRLTGRVASATTNSNNLGIQFNSDTSGVYTDHVLNGNATQVSSTANVGATRIQIRDCLPGNSNSSGVFGAAVIDLLEFNSSGEQDVILTSGVRVNTNAITSITLFDIGSTNLVIGTRASIYGIK